MKRILSTVLAVAALGYAGTAYAQQDLANAQITTNDIGNGAFELAGPGGNITVVPGDDGIIMVDAEFPPLHDKIKAAVTAISKQPIKYIVNTHFHPDHSSGDALFLKEGVTVVAQDNVKKRMLEGSTNGLTGAKTA